MHDVDTVANRGPFLDVNGRGAVRSTACWKDSCFDCCARVEGNRGVESENLNNYFSQQGLREHGERRMKEGGGVPSFRAYDK